MTAPKSFRARIVARRKKISKWCKSPTGTMWTTRRGPATLVALVAGAVSYRHIHTVTVAAGEPGWVAAIMALSIDGLMVVSANYITAAKTPSGRIWAFVGFLAGLGASVAANIMAAQPTLVGRVVAGWPAVALVLTAGVLHWGDKRPKVKRKTAPVAKTAPAPAHRYTDEPTTVAFARLAMG